MKDESDPAPRAPRLSFVPPSHILTLSHTHTLTYSHSHILTLSHTHTLTCSVLRPSYFFFFFLTMVVASSAAGTGSAGVSIFTSLPLSEDL